MHFLGVRTNRAQHHFNLYRITCFSIRAFLKITFIELFKHGFWTTQTEQKSIYFGSHFLHFQERIRIGKELLEAKRIEEQNERKRLVSFLLCICACTSFCLILLYSLLTNFFPSIGSMIELRRLEKEEEKRAREKIRQKLEEDKVSNFSTLSLRIFLTLSFKFLIDVGNTNNLALKMFFLSQAERRRKLGLPPEDPAASKPSAPPPVEEKKVFFFPEFEFPLPS